MKYVEDGVIRLSDEPQELFRALVGMLTIDNPKYIQAQRMGLPAWDIPRQLKLYRVENNELIVPRGLSAYIWRLRPQGTQASDRRTLIRRPPPWPAGGIHLRDYQQTAADRVLQSRWKQGVLVMPCGAGKTETGLYIAQQIGQPTLWIAHTKDLIEQSMIRAVERLGLAGEQVGMLCEGSRTIGTLLTVATIQTLYRMELDDLAGRFGCVIVDECQHCCANPASAEMYNRVLGELPAKHRYGLTATPDRGDGLTKTIHLILGPLLQEVTRDELEAAGGTVAPTVRVIPTQFRYAPDQYREAERIDMHRLRRHMLADGARMDLVLSHLVPELEQDHCCIVLASSRDILQELCRRISGAFPCRYIDGATRKRERAEALREIREGSANALFATYQLAKEGLDLPRADRLFFVQPVRDSTAVEQSAGRVMRPAPGKNDAVIYDFVDLLVPTCKHQFSARKRVYKKINAEIMEEKQ